MNSKRVPFLLLLVPLVMTGCAERRRYEAAPIVAAETGTSLESRNLADRGLRDFLEKNLGHLVTPWPSSNWDLNTLTLAALYFNPQIEIARAQAEAANAAVLTAGARPNPTLSISPGIPSPYLFGLDFAFPIERHGKRGIRIAQAQSLSEAARLGLAVAAWKVRSQVRESLTAMFVAEQRSELLRLQNNLLTTQVQLLQPRLIAGEIPRPDVDSARVALVAGQLGA